MNLSPIPSRLTAPSHRLPQLMRRHPLVFFYLMAFGFTWVYEIVFLILLHLPEDSSGAATPWLALATFVGPTASALIMTALLEGKAGIRRLLSRYVLWRVGFRWYLFILLGYPLLVILAAMALPGVVVSFHAPSLQLVQLTLWTFVLNFFLGGPLGEEPGWRGFALPRLQQLHGPLKGTLILGVLWGLWHLPLFLTSWGEGNNGVLDIILYVVFGTFFALIMTWVFNNTRGSLLIAMLFHRVFNSLSHFLPNIFSSPLASLGIPIALLVLALLLIVLTRGRLSYERYQRETGLPAPEAVVEQEPGIPGNAV